MRFISVWIVITVFRCHGFIQVCIIYTSSRICNSFPQLFQDCNTIFRFFRVQFSGSVILWISASTLCLLTPSITFFNHPSQHPLVECQDVVKNIGNHLQLKVVGVHSKLWELCAKSLNYTSASMHSLSYLIGFSLSKVDMNCIHCYASSDEQKVNTPLLLRMLCQKVDFIISVCQFTILL